MSRLSALFHKASRLGDELWTDRLFLRSRRTLLLMRVLTILWRGLVDNSIFSRAAALSYSSLLAMAPVLGVIVIFTGSFLKADPEAQIKRAIVFMAPSVAQYVRLDGGAAEMAEPLVPVEQGAGEESDPASTPAIDAGTSLQAEEMADAFDMLLSRMIDGVRGSVGGINKGGKGIAGTIGGILLIWIGISLLVAIENALNGIWGVKRGRAWGRRIVLYWAILSIGVLAGFVLIGLLSASTVVGMLDTLPMGEHLARLLVFIGPLVSVLGLALLLTFFYQFFPNTRVRFLPALAGGFSAAILLVLNNFLSILYINNVIRIQSLYGSMGIVLVLMFGLYLFWAFLLLGGQVTYAVQNAQFLADQRAWENVSERARETISFGAYALIARRFSRCQPPLSADELAELMRVPSNILNESLTRLVDMGLVTALDDDGDESGLERTCFSPARPLRSIDLPGFRRMYEAHGSDKGTELVKDVDGVIDLYRERLDAAANTLGEGSMEELLDRIPANAQADAAESGQGLPV